MSCLTSVFQCKISTAKSLGSRVNPCLSIIPKVPSVVCLECKGELHHSLTLIIDVKGRIRDLLILYRISQSFLKALLSFHRQTFYRT